MTSSIEDLECLTTWGETHHLPYGLTGRKAEILLRATELFAKNTYHAVSVGDIAAACGITQSSFYNHFASKEELLREVLAHAGYNNRIYVDALERHLEKANTYKEAIRAVFEEPKKMINSYSAYAICVCMSEQFGSNDAWQTSKASYWEYPSAMLRRVFARILPGWDAEGLIYTLISTISVALRWMGHHYLGRGTPWNPPEQMVRVEAFLLSTDPTPH
ncbi:MAG: TetR/AcrR family transcriptional regulator [Oscillospiraceae bacterium]|jgi:AcrR family transcriptional regulator|nr:TetR/AcrR family transcriptional regulator [Oscillospiraceae bacterium]